MEFIATAKGTHATFASKKAFAAEFNANGVWMTNRDVDDVFNSVVMFGTIQQAIDFLKAGNSILVVGPDPRTNRKWYANVVLSSKSPIGIVVK